MSSSPCWEQSHGEAYAIRCWYREMSTTMMTMADYLNVKERTLYRLVRDGNIPGFKIGGAKRFDRNDVDLWIQKQKDRGQKPVAEHCGEARK